MTLIEPATFRRAIDNVANWGDTDVFPFPVENHVMHDVPEEVVALLVDIAANFDATLQAIPIAEFSTLAPVGYTGFRWATQIDPFWNAYLLSLVLALGPSIESARISEGEEKIFSYRYRADPTESSIFAVDSWGKFQERTRCLAETHEYVVTADIGDFYSRIYHHRLENALSALDPGAMRSKQIMQILGKLSKNTSYGLPVGGPAARLLAELLLNRVDRLLAINAETATYARYADDYRFFVNSTQSAYKCIGFLSEKLLRNEGLSLQKTKTRIMTSQEYLSTLDPSTPAPGSAAAFLRLSIHYDPYSATAEADYEQLKDKLEQFDVLSLLRAELDKGRIHAALVRRLINALKFMDVDMRQSAIISLLDNLDTLAPVIAQVMLTIRDCLTGMDATFIDYVHSRIRLIITEEHHVAQVELNLSYMIRVLAVKRSDENERLLAQIYATSHGFNNDPAPNIRRDIMLILARWRATWWLSDQRNYLGSAHPWVKRAFIIGSYSLGDEGAHWRGANRAGMNSFDLVVRDWVAAKVQTPDWEIPL
jgi:hypothetical protein